MSTSEMELCGCSGQEVRANADEYLCCQTMPDPVQSGPGAPNRLTPVASQRSVPRQFVARNRRGSTTTHPRFVRLKTLLQAGSVCLPDRRSGRPHRLRDELVGVVVFVVVVASVGVMVPGCGVFDKSGDSKPADTWTDSGTGLTWQVTPTGGTMTWSEAKENCERLELAGDGWRMPTIGELRSLIRGCPKTERGGNCPVEEGGCLDWACTGVSCGGCSDLKGPGSNGCYWPAEMQGECSWYWSSSPVRDRTDHAWRVNFSYGHVQNSSVSHLNPANHKHVRCVR